MARTAPSVFLVFININADNATKDDVGSEEVLQRLKFLVATIQARTQNAALKSNHSWWPLRQSKASREHFLGYKLSMTLINQLSLSKDSLAKALNGQLKHVTATSLKKTLHGCFIFRMLDNSNCVAIASKARQLVWANLPKAVPTNETIVQQKSIHAIQLLHSICCNWSQVYNPNLFYQQVQLQLQQTLIKQRPHRP
jgi:hypothetical protein